jgi:hypothetical protein
MNKLKTIKRYVAGSFKYFDIFEVDVIEEVEEFLSATNRDMIRVVVDGQVYKGLHNPWVYQYFCANEGGPGVVALWKAPKGDYMLAYTKELWLNHLSGNDFGEIEDISHSDANPMSGESFLYMWVNLDTDKMYVGKHKGTINDGYICSSDSMLEDFNKEPERFHRVILCYGSDAEISAKETLMLLQLNAPQSPLFYNMSSNLVGK